MKRFHVGINPEHRYEIVPLKIIKRDIFYFDKIILNYYKGKTPFSDRIKYQERVGVISKEEAKEYFELYDKGILEDINLFSLCNDRILKIDAKNIMEEYETNLLNMNEDRANFVNQGINEMQNFDILNFEKHEKHFDEWVKKDNSSSIENIERLFNPYKEMEKFASRKLTHANQLIARMAAVIAEYDLDNVTEATPILHKLNNWVFQNHTQKTKVINVIIQEFPEIRIETNYSKILNFKTNEKYNIKLVRLRKWISEISKKEMSISEIDDITQSLLEDYKNALDALKIEYELKEKQIYVSTISEIFDIKKFIGKLFGKSIDIKINEFHMHNGENKAPGKQVAYIHEAKEFIEK